MTLGFELSAKTQIIKGATYCANTLSCYHPEVGETLYRITFNQIGTLKGLTFLAASLINCFAGGFQIAGTVMTHLISLAVYSVEVRSFNVSSALSLR